MGYDNSGLRRLQENLRGFSGTEHVPIAELLTPAFMREVRTAASWVSSHWLCDGRRTDGAI
jgi:hypothetical protein